MQTENTDWTKYSVDSIDFILSQSEKTMNETFVSYRENTNKSYAALAIYSGILSYCASSAIEKFDSKVLIFFLILSIGMLLCIGIIFINLKPKKMAFIGSCKSLLCQDYYENNVNKEDQIKEYKIQTIETYDESIKDNLKQIVGQVEAFKISVQVFVATILITFLSLFIIS